MTTEATAANYLEEYVPVALFGKDHWGVLAYVETRCVDDKGLIDPAKMRTNTRRHRCFAQPLHLLMPSDSVKDYPTRLREGEIAKHDDWDCLQDLAQAGYVEILDEEVKPTKRWLGTMFAPSATFPQLTCRVKMTELGMVAAGRLRAHLSAGGKMASFTLESEAQP